MEKMKGERGRIEDRDEGNLSEGEGKEEYERIEVEEIIEGEKGKEIWNERRKIENRKNRENVEKALRENNIEKSVNVKRINMHFRALK